MDTNYSFAVWFKNFRQKRGLTQEKFGDKLGYTTEYIRKLEGGRRPPTAGLAEKLAGLQDLQGQAYQEFIDFINQEFIHPTQASPSARGQQAPPTTDLSASATPALGASPYKGLTFFEETDAHLYYGRQGLIDELVSLLATVSASNSRLLTVIGASGSGKSSLVRAGLLPTLKNRTIDESDRWTIKILTPTAAPLKRLALALSEQASESASLQLITDLAIDERVLDLRASKLLATSGLTHGRLLLIIDQFEELFTLCKDPEECRAYIDNLVYAVQVDGPTLVILTLRADFYRHCVEHDQLRLLLERHTKTVGAMSDAELRAAIEGPAQANGWNFEAGLVDLFLDDVSEEPGALPLLSHALRETWERRRGHTLTLSGYSDIGRVQGAIATTANRVLEKLSLAQRMTAKQIFLRLTELGEGAEATRRRVRLTELLSVGVERPQVEQVLYTLANARLLTIHREEAEVAHEALIREWSVLRQWLTDNRDALRIHRSLTESANEWTKLGLDEGALYRGVRLAQAVAWVQEYSGELNVQEQRFLAASQTAAEAEKRAEEEARVRELAQQRQLAEAEAKRAKLAEERVQEREIAAARLKKGRNFLIAASTLALFLAALAGLFGLQSNQNASEANRQRVAAVVAQATTNAALTTAEVDRANAMTQQNTAQARATVAVAAQATAVVSARLANAERLAIQARFLGASIAPNDLDVALLLARQAVTTTLTNEGYVLASAELALSEAIDAAQRKQWHTAFVLPHPASVASVAYSPDGRLLVSACDDSIVRIWEVASGKEIRQLLGHTAAVLSATFSPNGQRIISAGADGTTRLWDVATGTEIRQLTGHTGTVNSAIFSPDGKQIVTAGEDRTVRLWDATSGEEIRQLIGHTDLVNSAIFSPDGQQIMSASADGTARLWDITNGKEIRQPIHHGNNIWSAAFSSDGQQIVTASEDTTTRVWNVAGGSSMRAMFSRTGDVRSVAFRLDDQQIVNASDDGIIRIWNVTSEQVVYQLVGHTARVRFAVFRSDGQQIASAGEDSTVRIWDQPVQQEVRQLIGHTGSVRAVTFSPNGEYLISASEDTTIGIWDVKSGEQLRHLTGHADSVRSAMFSADSNLIVSASEDDTVRIWNAKSGQEVRQLKGHTGAVWSAGFSPDSKQVVSAGVDTTVRVWDVASGTEIHQLVGNKDGVWSTGFSPDGKQVASGCADGTILIWDAASGTEMRRLTGHVANVWSVAFRSDGQQLVSAGDDTTVRIWNVASGQEVRQLLGHTAGVRSAVFSADGKQIVTASADRSIRLWDVASSKELRQLVGHTERVLWVTYSPDGQQIASSGADTTIRLWQVSIEDLLTQARTLIQREPPELTVEERQQYSIE